MKLPLPHFLFPRACRPSHIAIAALFALGVPAFAAPAANAPAPNAAHANRATTADAVNSVQQAADATAEQAQTQSDQSVSQQTRSNESTAEQTPTPTAAKATAPAPQPADAGQLQQASVVQQTPADTAPAQQQDVDSSAAANALNVAAPAKSDVIFVVPIKGPIDRTQLFILRRALKEATAENAGTVVLDMDTPGGALNTTLEMMEALQRFPGKTVTYVNSEAISAGSFIAVATDEIWFAPLGIIGAAEAVSGSGQEIGEGMQRKIRSYLAAKVRALNDGERDRYRADVQRAMMDPTFKLEIDGTVLKEPGELLSLTAKEAAATYGEPPQPLLSFGTAESLDALLDAIGSTGAHTARHYQLTWSESFAKWFQALVPLLLGLGMVMLFIEFKTPGFGVMGGIGIACLLLVFASNYFAGLAGYEIVIFFLIGVALLGVELLLFPGTLVAGALGSLLILGSLLWAMADVWPENAQNYELSPDMFIMPLVNLCVGLLIGVFGVVIVGKFFPKTRLGRSMILSRSVGGEDPLLAAGGSRSIYGKAIPSATPAAADGSLSPAGRKTAGTATKNGGGSPAFAGSNIPANAPRPAGKDGESAASGAPNDGTADNSAASATADSAFDANGLPRIGSRGTAVTPLRPSGFVEIAGVRFEAHLALGQIDRGEIIEVVAYRAFSLLVKVVTEAETPQH